MSINPYQVPAARREAIPESIAVMLINRSERFFAAFVTHLYGAGLGLLGRLSCKAT